MKLDSTRKVWRTACKKVKYKVITPIILIFNRQTGVDNTISPYICIHLYTKHWYLAYFYIHNLIIFYRLKAKISSRSASVNLFPTLIA